MTTTPAKTQPAALPEGKEIVDILTRADKAGAKPADLAAMRALLARSDVDLWRLSGDLARNARDAMLKTFSGSETFRESSRIAMDKLAADLAGQDAPPIERLLADQAALCWGQYHLTQWRYESVTAGSISLTQADYWERRLSTAQRRYLRSLEALARVRRLLRPGAIQVNIGQQVTAAQVLASQGKGDPGGAKKAES